MSSSINPLIAACRAALLAGPSRLEDEYFYNCVPLCVIDSVYSIGVRYEGVKAVVERYCQHAGIRKFRRVRTELPEPGEQWSTKVFVDQMRSVGAEAFAESVFRNRQRTSTRNGILKSQAVLEFSQVLVQFGGEFLQDIPALQQNDEFATAIKSITGQASGISLGYFFMLAGDEDLIKPDRMILRFLSQALERDVKVDQARPLLVEACAQLNPEFPELTPRLLDHCIWHLQRKES